MFSSTFIQILNTSLRSQGHPFFPSPKLMQRLFPSG
nr:hypothetical protein Iba_chr09eCG0460 [Ipomoea batatas]GMD38105.1 hypothetical protein Iba_chr09fCG0750 [Ipomoea batatas]